MTESRPHGRVKYVVEKCHCDVCRAAAAAYERHRQRQVAYGRWQPYVDAEPARQHVRSLQAAGLGWKRVAWLAGLSDSVVWKLLYGATTRNMGPSKRIRPATEARLLSVQASLDTLGAATPVDSTGTKRRLQALVARGWSMSKLGTRLGIQPTNMPKVMHQDRVLVGTARAVGALYEELWNVAPPQETHSDRQAFSRSVNYARRQGWVPPQAWDDDEIDNPSVQPEDASTPARLSYAETAEEYHHLISLGVSRDQARKQLGLTESALEQALYRARKQAA